jgi:glycosyltransferase involved in cell wall biosynthesis
MAHEIVNNTLNQINWFHVSPEEVKDNQLRKLDMSEAAATVSGVADASLMIFPYHAFGSIELIRLLIHNENIDAIVIFQDPRYWEWLFEHEQEIRQLVPIIFYNIWDNYPVPHYNKPLYESVDNLVAISKLTLDVNKKVLTNSKVKPIISHVPHGVNDKVFKPITEFDDDYKDFLAFKTKLIGDAEFVVLFNSRNMDRKNPMGVLEAFDLFYTNLSTEDKSKVKLVMHTNPLDQVGTDLLAYTRQQLCIRDVVVWNIDKYDDVKMNYLYNSASITISLSYNEGWGLSLTESGMAGTPVMAIVTGGMKDQLFGGCTYPLFSEVSSLLGSHPTPYIYCDRVSTKTVADRLNLAYSEKHLLEDMGFVLRKEYLDAKYTVQDMANGIAIEILKTIDTFKPKPDYELIKL